MADLSANATADGGTKEYVEWLLKGNGCCIQAKDGAIYANEHGVGLRPYSVNGKNTNIEKLQMEML